MGLVKKRVGKSFRKAESPFESATIFLILNAVFFIILGAFLFRVSTNALLYEQSYSKEIALLIDNAKPGTTILIDVSNGLKIAEDNKIVKEKIIQIDSAKNTVFVSLTGKGGYGFQYFSDYDVETGFNDQNQFFIKVKEKQYDS